MASEAVRATYDAAWSTLYDMDYDAERSGRDYQARDAARSAFYAAKG